MYSKNKNSANFPDPLVSQEVKESKDYGLKYAKALKINGETLLIQNRCTERETKSLKRTESTQMELRTPPFTSSF